MVRKGDCEGFYNTGNHEKGGDFGEISATHKRNLDSTSDQQVAFKRIRLSTDLNPQVLDFSCFIYCFIGLFPIFLQHLCFGGVVCDLLLWKKVRVVHSIHIVTCISFYFFLSFF